MHTHTRCLTRNENPRASGKPGHRARPVGRMRCGEILRAGCAGGNFALQRGDMGLSFIHLTGEPRPGGAVKLDVAANGVSIIMCNL